MLGYFEPAFTVIDRRELGPQDCPPGVAISYELRQHQRGNRTTPYVAIIGRNSDGKQVLDNLVYYKTAEIVQDEWNTRFHKAVQLDDLNYYKVIIGHSRMRTKSGAFALL